MLVVDALEAAIRPLGLPDVALSPKGVTVAALGLVVALILAWGCRPIVLSMTKFRNVPGPPPELFTGNLRLLRKYGGFHEALIKLHAQHGEVVRLFLGPSTHFLAFCDARAFHQIARADHRSFAHRGDGFTRLFPGSARERRIEAMGVVFERGDTWKGVRAVWAAFLGSDSAVEKYTDLMNTAVDGLLAVLDSAARDGAPIDIARAYGALTMDVVGPAAFGVEFGAQRAAADGAAGDTEILQAAREFFNTSTVMRTPYMTLIAIFPPLRHLLHPLARHVPDERLQRNLRCRAYLTRKGEELLAAAEGRGGGGGAPAPGCFLARMAASKDRGTGAQLSRDQVIAQARTFLLAGYETTASALAFATYLLAKHPEEQERVATEVREVLGGRTPTHDDIPKCTYTRACMNEALRLYPPAPITARFVTADTTITTSSGAEYRVREGDRVMMCIFSAHRSPRYWTDPEAFRPQRWLPDGLDGSGPEPREELAYMPFGAGPRGCIGKQFALEEASLTLMRVLGGYKLELTPGQEELKMTAGLTTSPAGGVHVRLQRR
ncbi:unnamed protein product [Pedinophyceae sp. YPF-701]|nr:unnamed protein product [Pedinophyceae sp. YPF-701]